MNERDEGGSGGSYPPPCWSNIARQPVGKLPAGLFFSLEKPKTKNRYRIRMQSFLLSQVYFGLLATFSTGGALQNVRRPSLYNSRLIILFQRDILDMCCHRLSLPQQRPSGCSAPTLVCPRTFSSPPRAAERRATRPVGLGVGSPGRSGSTVRGGWGRCSSLSRCSIGCCQPRLPERSVTVAIVAARYLRFRQRMSRGASMARRAPLRTGSLPCSRPSATLCSMPSRT